MPIHERPGVYTDYQVTSSVTGSAVGGVVGLAAKGEGGETGVLVQLRSHAQAAEAFGADSNLTRLARLALLNGATAVHAVAVAGDTAENYADAFALLGGDSQIRLLLCDSRSADVHKAMQNAIETASEACKYRIGVVEADGESTQLVEAAAALNSERMVLCTPAGGTGDVAAALAGVIAGSSDPALPVGGAVLYGIADAHGAFSDEDVDALVRGGVTPVENSAGEVSVVRGVTTRTTTGGAADTTWRELTTILIVDDVIPTVRAALRSRFARSKNTAQTRGAIRTQVIIELENKLAREIIDGYGAVSAEASAEDPSVCVVSFEFTVAHGLNQIHLTASITV